MGVEESSRKKGSIGKAMMFAEAMAARGPRLIETMMPALGL